MRKNLEWKFEEIDEFTKRVKVIGGWFLIYTADTANKEKPNNLTSCFISDRDHEWVIDKKLEQEADLIQIEKPFSNWETAE